MWYLEIQMQKIYCLLGEAGWGFSALALLAFGAREFFGKIPWIVTTKNVFRHLVLHVQNHLCLRTAVLEQVNWGLGIDH